MTTSPSYQSDFYTITGTLSSNASCYVERNADRELYDSLMQGDFCYILTSRQVGKSSLMVRTADRLRKNGMVVVTLDLQAIGQNLTAEQWYGGLLERTGEQLKLEKELDDFWEENYRIGPLQRWLKAIREIVLSRLHSRIVVFVDEIEYVRSLPFPTDEFFAGIRELYNRRPEDKELYRLSFCLLGTATPSELIKDTRTTLFNIGKRIELHDFTEEEAAPLAQGLCHEDNLKAKLVRRILHWTNGHPYLTQRLCLTLSETASLKGTKYVDHICNEVFLSPRAREQDENLLFVRERILRSEVDTTDLLNLYAQVHRRRRVAADEANPVVNLLQLSGITRGAEGYLRVRNRIYHSVFNQQWVASNMPDAELRRQRAAYWNGIRRAAIIFGSILGVMILLLVYVFLLKQDARRNQEIAEQQRQEAIKARIIAEDRQEKFEKEHEKVIKHQEIALQLLSKAEQATLGVDVMTWQTIKDETNPSIFRAYLGTEPSTQFAEKARRKLKKLRATQPVSSANPFEQQSVEPMKGAIIGQVLDAETQQPISTTTIAAINTDSGTDWKMFSNQKGKFIIAPLPPGSYTVTIQPPDYENKITLTVSLKSGQVYNIGAKSISKQKAQQ